MAKFCQCKSTNLWLEKKDKVSDAGIVHAGSYLWRFHKVRVDLDRNCSNSWTSRTEIRRGPAFRVLDRVLVYSFVIWTWGCSANRNKFHKPDRQNGRHRFFSVLYRHINRASALWPKHKLFNPQSPLAHNQTTHNKKRLDILPLRMTSITPITY